MDRISDGRTTVEGFAKCMHRAIGTRESLEKYEDLFNSEARKFLKATLRDPDNVQQHIR